VKAMQFDYLYWFQNNKSGNNSVLKKLHENGTYKSATQQVIAMKTTSWVNKKIKKISNQLLRIIAQIALHIIQAIVLPVT